jgi:regulator of replication initiation timing
MKKPKTLTEAWAKHEISRLENRVTSLCMMCEITTNLARLQQKDIAKLMIENEKLRKRVETLSKGKKR